MANTVIGSSIVSDGEISGDEDLVIQGTVKGRISLKESLMVESSGVVEADIETQNVEIGGRVTGNITATDKVELKSEDFGRRMALARPDDTAKGMFFNGVLTAVERMLGADAVRVVLEASGERKFVDFFNYPITSFLKMSFTATALLESVSGGHDAAFRRLGVQATNDFLGTAVGKTLLMLAGRDPKRLLSAVPGAFKTCVSYGERKMEFAGETRGTMTMLRDFMPFHYHEGVIEAVILALGVKDVHVKGRSLGTLDAAYDISWTPADSGGGK